MPYASLGILDIPRVAGNDVNMDMVDTLSGRWPHVYTDIVAVRLVLLIDELFLLAYQFHAGGNLFWRQLKEAGDMPVRDDHRMARAHRIGVAGTVSKVSLQRHPTWISTKQAWIIGVSLFLLIYVSRQTSTPFCNIPLTTSCHHWLFITKRYWQLPATSPCSFVPRNALNRAAEGHAENTR